MGAQSPTIRKWYMVLMVCDHWAVSYTPITAIFGWLTSGTLIKVAYARCPIAYKTNRLGLL